MVATGADRGGQVFHYPKIAAAHVAPVNLQQERGGAAPGLQADAVVEYAPIAAMSGIPNNIIALRL